MCPVAVRHCFAHAVYILLKVFTDVGDRYNELEKERGISTGRSRVKRCPFFVQVGTTAVPEVLAVPYLRDVTCCVGAAAGARVWTKLFDVAVKQGLLEKVWRATAPIRPYLSLRTKAALPHTFPQKLSRKLVHMTTGPIFILTWPLFRCGSL